MPTADLHSLTLVLTSPRSGSTLLCRDIASLGGLGFPREYLRGLGAEARRRPVSESDVLERIAQGVQDSAPGVAAVKLMVTQAAPTCRAITGRRPATPIDAVSGVVQWARERFDGRVLLVVLVRNTLDQAISRVVAQQTGIYHSSNRAFGGPDAVPVDRERINERIFDELTEVHRQRLALRAVAAEHAEIALLLTYDELTSQIEATTSRLVAHAHAQGLQVHQTAVTRRLEKVIDPEQSDSLRESFLDYLRTEPGR